METRDNILNELKQIAPTLAAVEKKNFYAVPDGYFADFKSSIVAQVSFSPVQQELKEVAPVLLNVERKPAVEVPIGYFTSFSKDLVKQIRGNEVQEELSALAPALSAIDKQNTLNVPANYFAQFPGQLMQQIKTTEGVAEKAAVPEWMQRVNIILENITAVIFKPKYSVGFAGLATMIIVTVMFSLKVEQQCADLECKMAQLTTEELSAYLGEDDADSYQDEIFEAALNENAGDVQVYKDVLQNVSDAELDNALLD